MQDTPNPMPVQESPDLPPLMQKPKKSNKTLIIILVVVLVLCCICLPLVGGISWFWQNGDQFMEQIQEGSYLLNLV